MNLQLNFNIESVFIDLEKLDNKPNSPIIEISLISENGEILLDTYINPGGNQELSDYKINVLNYDPDKLSNAKELDYFIPCIKELTKGKTLVGYGKSDIDALPWLKPHTIYLDACQRFSDRYGSYNYYHGDHTWVSLADACKEIGYIPNGIVHRSVVDAESCRQVWLHLNKIEANFQLPVYQKLKNSNLKVINNSKEIKNEPTF